MIDTASRNDHPVGRRLPSSGPPRLGRRAGKSRRMPVWLFSVLTILLVVWLLPFAWMILGSFKTQAEILRRPPTLWPEAPTIANFTEWFSGLNFGTFYANSVIVAVATVAGNLLFCSMVGYALAKLEFPGKRALFIVVMITLMVPGVVTFVPLFVLVANMGIIDTQLALILPFLTAPLGVFLMRQFMQGIPDALLEAARIDGAGEFRIFLRVVMPLCGPPLATLSILTFLASWNNFLWPLVAAQSIGNYTLPVALALFSTDEESTNFGLLLAGSVLVVVPVILLFLLLQKQFIRGVATAGLK